MQTVFFDCDIRLYKTVLSRSSLDDDLKGIKRISNFFYIHKNKNWVAIHHLLIYQHATLEV